jgi:hypothetical protein
LQSNHVGLFDYDRTQQVNINIKIMWNLGGGRLFTMMFTNNNEPIKSKVIIFTKKINIKLVLTQSNLLISLHQWIHKYKHLTFDHI